MTLETGRELLHLHKPSKHIAQISGSKAPHFSFPEAPFKQEMATSKVTASKDIAIWFKFCFMILTVKRECQSFAPKIKRKKANNFNFEAVNFNFGKTEFGQKYQVSIFRYQFLSFEI